MSEDSLASARWTVKIGAGLVVVGFFLMIRLWMWQSGSQVVPALGWVVLTCGAAVMAGAVEPDDEWLEYLLFIVSSVATVIGSLIMVTSAVVILLFTDSASRVSIADMGGYHALRDATLLERLLHIFKDGTALITLGFLTALVGNGEIVAALVRERFGTGEDEEQDEEIEEQVKSKPPVKAKKRRPPSEDTSQ